MSSQPNKTRKQIIKKSIFLCKSTVKYISCRNSGAWDPDPLNLHHIGFLDPDPCPDPEKYADPRIRIQGAKYQPKTGAKIFSAQNLNLLKKRDCQKCHSLNGSYSFSIKITEKRKKNNLKFFLLFSKCS